MGSHLNSIIGQKQIVRWQFAQCPYLPHALLTIGPHSNVRTNDSAFYDLLTGILKSLVLLQGSNLENAKIILLTCLLFDHLGPMRLKSPRSSRLFKLLIKLQVATSSTSGWCLPKLSSTGVPLRHLSSTCSGYQYSRCCNGFGEIEY